MAVLYRPKLIIAGTSAYPRLLDYPRFRKVINDKNELIDKYVNNFVNLKDSLGSLSTEASANW